jgi:hypothetical protein
MDNNISTKRHNHFVVKMSPQAYCVIEHVKAMRLQQGEPATISDIVNEAIIKAYP